MSGPSPKCTDLQSLLHNFDPQESLSLSAQAHTHPLYHVKGKLLHALAWLPVSVLLAKVQDKLWFIGRRVFCYTSLGEPMPTMDSCKKDKVRLDADHTSSVLFILILCPYSSSPSSPPSLSFPFTPSSLCSCMLLTCSWCSTCSERFVRVSAVKATLVGPLSWSLWLSGSPLREPRGGCHYTHCQWNRHNRLALSIVWAQAWGWHQHLIHSTPVSLPPPSVLHPNRPTAM